MLGNFSLTVLSCGEVGGLGGGSEAEFCCKKEEVVEEVKEEVEG